MGECEGVAGCAGGVAAVESGAVGRFEFGGRRGRNVGSRSARWIDCNPFISVTQRHGNHMAENVRQAGFWVPARRVDQGCQGGWRRGAEPSRLRLFDVEKDVHSVGTLSPRQRT